MENIETLLAAVAQTQGFVDEGPVPFASTSPERGSEPPKPPAVIEIDAPSGAPADVVSSQLKEVGPVAGPPIATGEKRKRGRPPKGQLRVKPPPPKRNKMAEDEEEEDVCFICFDGGSLVLCDRKGCPKAYHPACIKRDEAFFRSKAKWNCGWHICSVCRKASYYMCYTCTFSLCKGCSKDTDYVRVRGNKGFCLTCMKTIMLIENKDQANNEIKVDFDDQTSWEYLFKVYWVALKEKLSLTLNDLTRAKSPRKGVTAVGYLPPRSILISASVSADIPFTNSSMDSPELKKPHVENNLPLPSYSINVEKLNDGVEGDGPTKQSMDKGMQETYIEKSTDKPVIEKDQENINTPKDTDKPCVCKNMNDEVSKKQGVDHSTEWATKNLLEFVAHVKDGDVAAMSIFDVQTLLLDYINTNNLWDPRRKSHIKCDPLLESIFGKTCVGHIEMLKLLKSHILVKEDSQSNSSIPAGFVSSVRYDEEVDESVEDIKSVDSNKKDECVKPGRLSYPQNGRKLDSPNEGKEESSAGAQDNTNGKADTGKSNSLDRYMNQENPYLSTNSTNDREMQRSELETSTSAALVGNSPSPNVVEMEKLWHYRDPDGKIRGPFSMLQLRECSTTGLYAPDMRVWTNHEQYDSVFLTDALSGRFHGSSDLLNVGSGGEEMTTGEIKVISEGTIISGEESKKVETYSNDVSVSSENDVGSVRGDKSGSWPQCWDLLTDNDNNNNNHSNSSDVNNALPPGRLEEKHEALLSGNFRSCETRRGGKEENSAKLSQYPITSSGCEVQNEYNTEDHVGPSAEEHVKSLNIDLSSNTDPPVQNTGFLELLSPAPRSGNEEDNVTETKNPSFANFPVQISEMVDELCKFPFEFSLKPPETTFRDHPTATSVPDLPPPPQPQSNVPSWLASANEPIEFDALGEDSVSDLLAEVDAMESQGAPHSPSVAFKFAREFLEEYRDDCFTSVEDFGAKNDSLMRPGEHSAASSEGETNAPGGPGPPPGPALGPVLGPGLGPPDVCVDQGRGTVQGHINLVTVQGNVNLVLGGPTGWVSPGLGRGPIGGSMPWDGQWKYGGGERFASPREWPVSYQGVRAPWGRQGGLGYQRSVPKGQRVCKFYESGHCKKGAFCDYLHP